MWFSNKVSDGDFITAISKKKYYWNIENIENRNIENHVKLQKTIDSRDLPNIKHFWNVTGIHTDIIGTPRSRRQLKVKGVKSIKKSWNMRPF